MSEWYNQMQRPWKTGKTSMADPAGNMTKLILDLPALAPNAQRLVKQLLADESLLEDLSQAEAELASGDRGVRLRDLRSQ